ncbi:MAG: YdjY domain-containing protein [Planctomycetota bacterium]|nr:YdjY domain-containing protein [Planctomycetota bacterium]
MGCQQDRHEAPTKPIGAQGEAPKTPSKWVELQPGLRISPGSQEVLLDAEVCLSDGWLEQVVCSVGTREHESIMVTSVPASALHAGLLAVGFQPGQPGQWHWEGGTVIREAPQGSDLEILVAPLGEEAWVPVRDWIMDEGGQSPQGHWVFGGSTMRDVESVPAGYSRYEADLGGSIIGLVTFGDETVGFSEVIPDEVAMAPEEWRVRVDAVPPVGSAVHVLIRPLPNPG